MSISLAIIPARGGSKRIPRKNVRPFAGRPILGWPILVALESKLFDRIIVSTDDEQIAACARAEGAETPFLRPAHLADDTTATRPVLRHAVEAIEKDGSPVAYACCLYATSPFITVEDLTIGKNKLLQDGADFAFGAVAYPHPIQRAFRVRDGGGVQMLQPEKRQCRTQDLEEFYHDAGMFHWATRTALFSDLPVFSETGHPVMIQRERAHDIDTVEDWARAELAFRVLAAGSAT